ncbi:MAG: lytic transglycosylase domain-containing protein, partial [Psychromonas sp.]|nr:lytic transglycosylase domain-containing protein [Psychromonas sp.]
MRIVKIGKVIPILLLSFLLSNKVWADIYIYIDKKGNQHFAERKVNSNYRLLLRSATNKAPATFKNWKEK